MSGTLSSAFSSFHNFFVDFFNSTLFVKRRVHKKGKRDTAMKLFPDLYEWLPD